MNKLEYSTIQGDKAVIRIQGDIGTDVTANQFVSEFKYITDELGITNVDVRINSGGGSVFEGFTIFSEIYKSAANVTTYNDGIAASTAGWIFLAGKNAVMSDYAQLMVHNPYSSDKSSKGNEVVDFIRTSILTILSKRSGIDRVKLGDMMDKETWLNAGEALVAGMATGVEETKRLVQLNPATQSVNVMLEICNKALDIKYKIVNDMDENLNSSAEEQIEKVEDTVDQPEVKVDETAEAKVEESAEEKEAEVVEPVAVVDEEKQALVKANAELMEKLATLETAMNKINEEKEAVLKAEKEAKSVELVNNSIQLGKIKTEAKEQWLNLANSNYDLAKSTLDALLMNKKADNILDKVKVEATAVENKLSLRELEMKNPKLVEDMYFNNRIQYNELYKAQYGVYPK